MTTQTLQETNNELAKYLTECSFDPNIWYISIAVTKEASSEELLTIIRSLLPAELEKQGLQRSLSYQQKEIIKKIHNYVRQAQSEARLKGKDIFVSCAFHESNLNRSTLKNAEEILEFRSFPVMEVIDINLSINHIPDLTYIYSLATTEKVSDIMIVTVDPKLAVCYRGNKVLPENIVFKEKNIFSKPEDNEYSGVVPSSHQNQRTHGTGNEKVERTFESGLLLFVKNQLERVQKQLNPKIIYLFFSQTYKSLGDEIGVTLNDIMLTQKVHIDFISSDQFENIQVGATVQDETVAQESRVDSNKHNSVSDLHKVAGLIRMGNIDTLYIAADLDEFGYVTKDSHCYTYPVKGSKKVESIRPWLIKSAIDISAQVKITKDQDINSSVLGLPRY